MDTIETGATSDREFYDNENMGTRQEHEVFMAEISSYFSAYSSRLRNDLAGTRGVVAELGAGSCGLSACLSQLPEVSRVYSADISAIRMQKGLALSTEILKGELSKIEVVPSDFNQRLQFDDGSLDALLFDAALHHVRSMWTSLAECSRVLRDGGILVAQRESYLSPLRAGNQIEFLLRSPEVAAKVSENIYLLEQYCYYLKVAGFDVEFIPHSPRPMKRLLRPLNGILFTDGVLYCRKRPAIR